MKKYWGILLSLAVAFIFTPIYIQAKNSIGEIVQTKEKTGYRYKIENGIVYKRLYNYSQEKWIGDWIVVSEFEGVNNNSFVVFEQEAQEYANQYFSGYDDSDYVVHVKSGGYLHNEGMDENYKVSSGDELMTVKQAKENIKEKYFALIQEKNSKEYVDQCFADISNESYIAS